MKKPIIITGNTCSGKSFLAKTFTKMFDKPEIIDCRGAKNIKQAIQRSNISFETDVIVFDDLSDLNLIIELSKRELLMFDVLGGGRYVIPKPQIIITTDEIGKHTVSKILNDTKHTHIHCDLSEDRVFSFNKIVSK